MEDYRSRLKEQLKEINTLLDRSDRDIERLKDVPRYEIRIHKSNGCDQYHLVDRTTGNKRYVKAGEVPSLHRIAQKAYEERVRKELLTLKHDLEVFILLYYRA